MGWGGCGGEVPVPALTAASPQVRRMYRRYFRSGASTRLANFIYRRLVSRAGGEGARRRPAPQQWGWARGPPHPPPFPPPQVQKFLMGLQKNLPPMSVQDRTWPLAPYKFLAGANQELKNIFYHWKVGALGMGGGCVLPVSLCTSGTASSPSLCSARSTGTS